jgi:hypothetical protein
VRAEEEDKSPDFSKEEPQTHVGGEAAPAAFDRAAWEGEVRRLSAGFRKYPEVYFATVVLQVTNSDSRMVSSEGSAIETPSASTRLIMEAQTRADDGMELLRVETFQAPSASGLPGEADLTAKIPRWPGPEGPQKRRRRSLHDGPALLSERPRLVFFHEVLGHWQRAPPATKRGWPDLYEESGPGGFAEIPRVAGDPTIRELAGVKLEVPMGLITKASCPASCHQNGVLRNFCCLACPSGILANPAATDAINQAHAHRPPRQFDLPASEALEWSFVKGSSMK